MRFYIGDKVKITSSGFNINSSIVVGEIKTIKSFSNKFNNYKYNIEFTDGSYGGSSRNWNTEHSFKLYIRFKIAYYYYFY